MTETTNRKLSYTGVEGIGLRLRRARRDAGLTQADLGQQAGSNQAVIQKIENGASFRPREIMNIAKVLGCNPAWLQFGEPYATREIPA